MTEVEFAEIRYQLGVKRPMEDVIDPMLLKLHRQVQVLEALARDWQEQGKQMVINHEIVKGKVSEAKSGLIHKLKHQTEVVWESMRLEQVETEEIA
jgi:hypothetical protein